MNKLYIELERDYDILKSQPIYDHLESFGLVPHTFFDDSGKVRFALLPWDICKITKKSSIEELLRLLSYYQLRYRFDTGVYLDDKYFRVDMILRQSWYQNGLLEFYPYLEGYGVEAGFEPTIIVTESDKFEGILKIRSIDTKISRTVNLESYRLRLGVYGFPDDIIDRIFKIHQESMEFGELEGNPG